MNSIIHAQYNICRSHSIERYMKNWSLQLGKLMLNKNFAYPCIRLEWYWFIDLSNVGINVFSIRERKEQAKEGKRERGRNWNRWREEIVLTKRNRGGSAEWREMRYAGGRNVARYGRVVNWQAAVPCPSASWQDLVSVDLRVWGVGEGGRGRSTDGATGLQSGCHLQVYRIYRGRMEERRL